MSFLNEDAMLGWTAGARSAGRWQYVCGAVLLTGFIAGAATLPASSGNAAAAAMGYSVSLLKANPDEQFVAVNPGTDTVFFARTLSAQLTIVNGATGAVSGTVALGTNARNVAVDTSTGDVWVSEAGTESLPGFVQVIDGATNTVTATIPFSFSRGQAAVNDSADTAYVAGNTAATGAVTVIDGATNTVTSTIGTGAGSRPYGVAVDQKTGIVWVTNLAGSVIAIDGASNSISGTVSMGGSEPTSVAVDPASGTAYVTDRKNDDIAVFGGSPTALITTIPLGADLFGIALDPRTGTIYAISNPTSSQTQDIGLIAAQLIESGD